MRSRETCPGRAGFTLVEVLLALALMGIVLAAAHEVLTSTVRRTDMVLRGADRRVAAGTLADVLAGDLAGLYPRKGAAPSFTLSLPLGVAGSGMELAFDTSTPALGLPQGQVPEVRRVTYHLAASQATPGTYALWRAVADYPSKQKPLDKGALLADGLSTFEASAFDGAQWVNQWPKGEGTGLPAGVRLSFGLAGREESVMVAVNVSAARPPAAAVGAGQPAAAPQPAAAGGTQ
jgi:prepilin-type N-terminal cleavage/methylation domain-containing protein